MIENADARIADYDNRYLRSCCVRCSMTKKSAEQEAYRSEAKKLRIQKKDLGGWMVGMGPVEVRTYLNKYKYARDAYTYLEVVVGEWMDA